MVRWASSQRISLLHTRSPKDKEQIDLSVEDAVSGERMIVVEAKNRKDVLSRVEWMRVVEKCIQSRPKVVFLVMAQSPEIEKEMVEEVERSEYSLYMLEPSGESEKMQVNLIGAKIQPKAVFLVTLSRFGVNYSGLP